MLMSCCSCFWWVVLWSGLGGSQVLVHRFDADPRAGPEGTAEGLTSNRELNTRHSGMHVGTPPRPDARGIGHHDRSVVRVRADGHPQQLASGAPLPTSDTGPDRSGTRVVRGSGRGPGVRDVLVDHRGRA